MRVLLLAVFLVLLALPFAAGAVPGVSSTPNVGITSVDDLQLSTSPAATGVDITNGGTNLTTSPGATPPPAGGTTTQIATTPPGSGSNSTLATLPPLGNEIACRLAFDPTCSDPSKVLAGITDWLMAISVTLFFFMFLYAGLKYLTSAGSQPDTEGAKKGILFAVIGMVIIIASWAAIKFIFDELLL
jgi:hypothetical protein